MSRDSGFTLIEVLVAVAVFGLAAALAYGGLSGLARTRAQLQEQSERLQALQFAIGLIERDLRAVVDRPVRDGGGGRAPALQASGQRIELSRIGRANALAARRSGIERVAYQLDRGQLQRLRYDVLDRADRSVPEVQLLLDGVERLRIRVIDQAGREIGQWPPERAGPTPALPRAVEVTLVLTGGLGEIRRLLELPSAPEPAP